MHARVSCAVAFGALTVLLLLSHPSAEAARCQISSVTYAYPHQAATNQQIQTETTVAGSCVSTGEDYYSVRVDLVQPVTGSIISSNSTPVGYNADNFTVTAENRATTPPNNGTWSFNFNVYVIRAGGTGGSYLRDYSTVGNATIQIGPGAAVPEFPAWSSATLAALLCAAVLIVRSHGKPKKTAKGH